MTCWRRLRDWYQAGVWRRLHQVLLEELAQAERIDWDRAALDIHLAFLQLGCALISLVSSANHVQLARTVGLDRRARPLQY